MYLRIWENIPIWTIISIRKLIEASKNMANWGGHLNYAVDSTWSLQLEVQKGTTRRAQNPKANFHLPTIYAAQKSILSTCSFSIQRRLAD
jgi:hypothetical protein